MRCAYRTVVICLVLTTQAHSAARKPPEAEPKVYVSTPEQEQRYKALVKHGQLPFLASCIRANYFAPLPLLDPEDLVAKDLDGNTPLLLAARFHRLSFIEWLLEKLPPEAIAHTNNRGLNALDLLLRNVNPGTHDERAAGEKLLRAADLKTSSFYRDPIQENREENCRKSEHRKLLGRRWRKWHSGEG